MMLSTDERHQLNGRNLVDEREVTTSRPLVLVPCIYVYLVPVPCYSSFRFLLVIFLKNIGTYTYVPMKYVHIYSVIYGDFELLLQYSSSRFFLKFFSD